MKWLVRRERRVSLSSAFGVSTKEGTPSGDGCLVGDHQGVEGRGPYGAFAWLLIGKRLDYCVEPLWVLCDGDAGHILSIKKPWGQCGGRCIGDKRPSSPRCRSRCLAFPPRRRPPSCLEVHSTRP